jgi:hypothetical protein
MSTLSITPPPAAVSATPEARASSAVKVTLPEAPSSRVSSPRARALAPRSPTTQWGPCHRIDLVSVIAAPLVSPR